MDYSKWVEVTYLLKFLDILGVRVKDSLGLLVFVHFDDVFLKLEVFLILPIVIKGRVLEGKTALGPLIRLGV